jgi:hypothetical protein
LTENFHNQLETKEREYHLKFQQLENEKELLRNLKDTQIKTLEKEKEEQREMYEKRINEMEIIIKCNFPI